MNQLSNDLSNDLSSLDDLEIYCLEHDIPCIGICSKFNCNTKTKFFCMKCIKAGNTCITTQKHELITLSEILYRFYNKKDTINNKTLQKIKKMGKILGQYRGGELDNVKDKFKNIKDQIIPIKKIYNDLIDKFIISFKEKNAKEMHNLKTLSKTDEVIEKDISNIFLNIRMPIFDKKSLSNNKKLKKMIDDGNRLSTPENFVQGLKILNDESKSSKYINKLNDKIFANKVCSNISNIDNNKDKLEQKIDTILKEFEEKIDQSLETLKTTLLTKSKNTNIAYAVTPFLNFTSNPKNLYLTKNICYSAHKTYLIDKVFCAFTSFQKQALVIWGANTNLEFYDIDKNKMIKEIASAHFSQIYCCRHFPDNKNKVDYVLTTSYDCSIKIWNAFTYECYSHIKNIYLRKNIFSACLLIDEHISKSHVVSSCVNDFMKLYDIDGRYKHSFGISDGNTVFINSYFDYKNKGFFIINGNANDVRSYNVKTGQLYQRYQGLPRFFHTGAVIQETKNETTLIEIDGNGFIRIWNFHTAELIKTIFVNPFINLRGICLWSHKYLIIGGNDHQIKVVDLKLGKAIKGFKDHNAHLCTLEKINSQLYGECLLSQGMDGSIKLWSIQ